MSKFGCTCGHVISDVVVPNEVTGWLLSDKSGEFFFDKMVSVIDEYSEYQAKGKETEFRLKYFDETYPDDINPGGIVHDILTSYFFSLTLDVLECKNCGNIWVQKHPDENFYLKYSPQGNEKDKKQVLGFNVTKNLESKDFW